MLTSVANESRFVPPRYKQGADNKPEKRNPDGFELTECPLLSLYCLFPVPDVRKLYPLGFGVGCKQS